MSSPADSTVTNPSTPPWWNEAVFYQIYPRSFADSNGDGIGDLGGIEDKLGYLELLGVDALWLSPVMRSPMADHGYDVSDPRDIDPCSATWPRWMHCQAAHARDIKVTMDLVPNHTSVRARWFRAALASAPGSPERCPLHLPRRPRRGRRRAAEQLAEHLRRSGLDPGHRGRRHTRPVVPAHLRANSPT